MYYDVMDSQSLTSNSLIHGTEFVKEGDISRFNDNVGKDFFGGANFSKCPIDTKVGTFYD